MSGNEDEMPERVRQNLEDRYGTREERRERSERRTESNDQEPESDPTAEEVSRRGHEAVPGAGPDAPEPAGRAESDTDLAGTVEVEDEPDVGVDESVRPSVARDLREDIASESEHIDEFDVRVEQTESGAEAFIPKQRQEGIQDVAEAEQIRTFHQSVADEENVDVSDVRLNIQDDRVEARVADDAIPTQPSEPQPNDTPMLRESIDPPDNQIQDSAPRGQTTDPTLQGTASGTAAGFIDPETTQRVSETETIIPESWVDQTVSATQEWGGRIESGGRQIARGAVPDSTPFSDEIESVAGGVIGVAPGHVARAPGDIARLSERSIQATTVGLRDPGQTDEIIESGIGFGISGAQQTSDVIQSDPLGEGTGMLALGAGSIAAGRAATASASRARARVRGDDSGGSSVEIGRAPPRSDSETVAFPADISDSSTVSRTDIDSTGGGGTPMSEVLETPEIQPEFRREGTSGRGLSDLMADERGAMQVPDMQRQTPELIADPVGDPRQVAAPRWESQARRRRAMSSDVTDTSAGFEIRRGRVEAPSVSPSPAPGLTATFAGQLADSDDAQVPGSDMMQQTREGTTTSTLLDTEPVARTRSDSDMDSILQSQSDTETEPEGIGIGLSGISGSRSGRPPAIPGLGSDDTSERDSDRDSGEGIFDIDIGGYIDPL